MRESGGGVRGERAKENERGPERPEPRNAGQNSIFCT